ncbi:MAG TPA: M20/M25/M40 family metallo-hydrolase [Blastocatellia bacterium]|nr:M20/M25/M40 family metallo-hydrolase [Blastocatellia bacterium]
MKNRLYRFLPFILLFILAQVAFAQQAPSTAPSIAPDVEALKKHVGYLASDELEGRRPGTAGADKAADYLAEEFHRLKLGCASNLGEGDLKCSHNGKRRDGYLREFPFIAGVELAKNNAMSFTRDGKNSAVALGAEWTPLGFSSNGAVARGALVFAGYGITAADLKYDDYANLDAKGKVAVVFAGSPDGDNPHGQFGRYADARLKAVAAKDHGAVALVVIAGDEKFGNDRLSKLSYDQTAGEAGIPVAVISRQTAAKWSGMADASQLNALEKAKENWAEYAQKLGGVTVGLSVEITRRAVPAYNVVGVIEGNDPKLKREYIVIGAHYDHLGHGGDSSLAPNSSDVHHGADDNASGTAGMLELARIFSGQRGQLRRSVIFIAFSAEESGLIGSNAYVNNPAAPLANTVAMINLDMIGRLKENKLTIGGIGTSPEFRKLVESLNNGFTLQLSEDGFGPSDHSSFYAKQIPVLFFFSGTHEDYHKPSDTADKINYEGQAKIVGFVAEIARAIDRGAARPAYAVARSQSSGRATGFRVYLGTVPNYAESNDGMLLDAVRDDSPAAKAGLKAGDKIVKLAGREIKNVYDYTYALGEIKPDQEYEVEVIRGDQRLKLKLTPQARR